jgi:hypothetical protein
VRNWGSKCQRVTREGAAAARFEIHLRLAA